MPIERQLWLDSQLSMPIERQLWLDNQLSMPSEKHVWLDCCWACPCSDNKLCLNWQFYNIMPCGKIMTIQFNWGLFPVKDKYAWTVRGICSVKANYDWTNGKCPMCLQIIIEPMESVQCVYMADIKLLLIALKSMIWSVCVCVCVQEGSMKCSWFQAAKQ